ncbi:hypothetical protein GCM10018952_21940 [Streptosporangium vulgare]
MRAPLRETRSGFRSLFPATAGSDGRRKEVPEVVGAIHEEHEVRVAGPAVDDLGMLVPDGLQSGKVSGTPGPARRVHRPALRFRGALTSGQR